MLQNNLLNKIDMCLKSYVDENNARYKRNISTTLMTKKQLRNFYYDMQQLKQQENIRKKKEKENVNRGPKRKSKSINSYVAPTTKFASSKDQFKSKDHPSIVDWRKANKILMNEKPLITNPVNLPDQAKGPLKNMSRNFSQKESEEWERIKGRRKRKEKDGEPSGLYEGQMKEYILQMVEIKEKSQPWQKIEYEKKQSWLSLDIKGSKKSKQAIEDGQELDTQEIEVIKAEEQIKYIKKHLRHIKNRQIYEDKYREDSCLKQFQVSPEQVEQIKMEMHNIQKEEKLHLKLKQIFENYAEKMEKEELLNTNKQVQAIKREKERRDCYSAAIESYFIRKNLHHRTCLQIKQQKAKVKYSKKARLLENDLINQFVKKEKKCL